MNSFGWLFSKHFYTKSRNFWFLSDLNAFVKMLKKLSYTGLRMNLMSTGLKPPRRSDESVF